MTYYVPIIDDTVTDIIRTGSLIAARASAIKVLDKNRKLIAVRVFGPNMKYVGFVGNSGRSSYYWLAAGTPGKPEPPYVPLDLVGTVKRRQ